MDKPTSEKFKRYCISKNFGVFNAKGKFSRAIREKLAEKSENFDPVESFPDNGMNYVAYTDGSCDNHSKYKAGGSAYIVLKDGEIVKMKNHGRLYCRHSWICSPCLYLLYR